VRWSANSRGNTTSQSVIASIDRTATAVTSAPDDDRTTECANRKECRSEWAAVPAAERAMESIIGRRRRYVKPMSAVASEFDRDWPLSVAQPRAARRVGRTAYCGYICAAPRSDAVGWRERDWARFNDGERRALFGAGGREALPPSAEGRDHPGFAPLPRTSRTRTRSGHATRNAVSGSVLLAACITGAAIFVSGHIHLASQVHAPLSTAPRIVQPPINVVGIRWRPRDLAPAPTAGRICVTDPRHGQICASYVIGERPADTLTREIERRGLHVRSSG
jgi:hypothetical protein